MDTLTELWVLLGVLLVGGFLLAAFMGWLFKGNWRGFMQDDPVPEEPTPQYVYMTDGMYGRLMGSYGRAETDAAYKQRRIDQLEEEKKQAEQSPPGMEELVLAAEEKYRLKVRLIQGAILDELERRSALEKAKQDYLRELNEVMK